MSAGDVLFLAATGLFVLGAWLLGAKLFRMLFRDGPHWVGGSPWYVDRRSAPGDYAFFVGVVGVGFLVAMAMAALFTVAAFRTYL